ncbi:MAG TPA: HAD-IA family hydrolase [Pseudonocardiaceae bacterium]|nr:HAD-IA family hydrolase [Pseudonocardiaceae bacterium]
MPAVTVRAVVFDYFGTLTPTVLAMITDAERWTLGKALGVDAEALDTAWAESFVERSTGKTGDLRATLRLLATRLGGDPSEAGLTEATAIRSSAYRRSARPRPDAPAVLGQLRASGYRLAVVSDCSDELVGMWPELPVASAVDTAVFSSVVGVRKPDPLMYRTACEGLGVEPAECVYVGDGGSGELTGAAAMGMRAVLLADDDWAVGHRYDADDWHGESIHRLADVPGLLAVADQ